MSNRAEVSMHVQASWLDVQSISARPILLPWPWKTLAACTAAAPNLEAELHSENVVFVIEKTQFGIYFDHLKGGVRDTRILVPIYQ